MSERLQAIEKRSQELMGKKDSSSPQQQQQQQPAQQ